MKNYLLISVSAILLLCFISKASGTAFAMGFGKLGLVMEKSETNTSSDDKKSSKEEIAQAILLVPQETWQNDFLAKPYQALNVGFRLPKSFLNTLEKPPQLI